MPSAFVPFLNSGGKTAPAALPAATPMTDSAPGAGAFAALVPSGASVNPTTVANCTHAANGALAKPVVTLQKDGERVTHIRIQCGCGQVVELECAY